MCRCAKLLMSLMLTGAMVFSIIGPAAAADLTEPDESAEMLKDIEVSEFPDSVVGEEADLTENDTPPSGIWSDTAPIAAADADLTAQLIREAAATDSVVPSYQAAYEAMVALQTEYPEGMTWTNFTPYGRDGNLGDTYWFRGGKVKGASGGVGCAAFVFILSDAAFDNLPARTLDNGSFTFDDVKVGDILRVNNSHFVIVLQKSVGGVVVAEANYNKSVHWGRAMSKDEVLAANFLVTRYPENYKDESEADVSEVIHTNTESGLTWTLTKGGMLTITGSGTIPDYSPNDDKIPGWDEYNDKINAITIGSGITSIGDYAFYQSNALSVSIPNTVISIGQSTFYGAKLVAVTIPGSVQCIGNDAFRGCKNMTSVSVSEGLKTIGERAFHSCTSLQYIDFPASITSVGSGAFAECGGMISLRFKPSTSSVTVGDNPFTNCKNLVYVTLPEKIDKISNGMFSGCNMLQYLCIPAGVTQIYEAGAAGGSPFLGSGISHIDFGGSETDWNNKGGKQALTQTTGGGANITVKYNVPFNNPFAADPNDPGDLVTDPDAPPVNPDNPQNQHSWSEAWASDADSHWHNCTDANCQLTDNSQKDGYAVHIYGEWVTDTGATASQAGSRHRDCSVCGYRQTESIPAAGGGASGTVPAPAPDISYPSTGSSPQTGPKTETTKKPDGSSVVVVTQKDGTVVTTITDASGKTGTEIKLSASALNAAMEHDQPISLPITAVEMTRSIADAPAITVYTGAGEPMAVAIPVASPSAGTVAVIIGADGSTEVVKTSVPTGDSIVAPLTDGATVKLVDNSKNFSDVPAGDWFESAVAFVSARELFTGTTDTTFAPEDLMTRAMLMTVLARFDGADTAGGTTWYAKGVEWATTHGISDGADPGRDITREQLVTMLWRYLGSPMVDDALSEYTDVEQISSYAREAMQWAVKNGIIHGFGDGRLGSQEQATRAQAAQILKNFIEHMTPDMI